MVIASQALETTNQIQAAFSNSTKNVMICSALGILAGSVSYVASLVLNFDSTVPVVITIGSAGLYLSGIKDNDVFTLGKEVLAQYKEARDNKTS